MTNSPDYPSPLDPDIASWVNQLDANQREYFEERAAIAEFEAGLNRLEAEQLAYQLTLQLQQLQQHSD